MILPVVGRRLFTGLEIGAAVPLLAVTVEIFLPSNGGIGWYLKDDLERTVGMRYMLVFS